MLTEKQMDAALAIFQARMEEISEIYFEKMGKHIRQIGQLAPSDVHRLQQLRRLNRNLADIEKRLAKAADLNIRDLETVLREAAKADERVVKKITGVSDAEVRLENNVPLQRALRAQLLETGGRMANLSNTTVVESAYRNAVDAAVTAAQSGAEDYESAIRRTLARAGEMGLRVRENGTKAVTYASGRSLRVDTAVRMNVLDAMRRMNQRAMEEVGRQFGADGVEIDAHMLCAEDHLPYQGGQFSNEEFGEIQDSLDRPFGEWNCRHTWSPIILGVSPPAYPAEELERFRKYSTEEVTIDGQTRTRYEWSQVMRRMETAIREKKDTAILAKAAGDGTLQRQCQGTINALMKRYEILSDKAGLGPDFRRTYVAGFRDVKLTGGAKGDTIKTDEEPGEIKRLEWLKKGYERAVEKGDISALTGFEHYEKVAETIERELVGYTTSSGLEVKGYKTHFIDRIIGGYEQKREPVEIETVKKALINPVEIKHNKPEKSAPSDVYIISDCKVAINPVSGILIQVSPRGRGK